MGDTEGPQLIVNGRAVRLEYFENRRTTWQNRPKPTKSDVASMIEETVREALAQANTNEDDRRLVSPRRPSLAEVVDDADSRAIEAYRRKRALSSSECILTKRLRLLLILH